MKPDLVWAFLFRNNLLKVKQKQGTEVVMIIKGVFSNILTKLERNEIEIITI